MTDSDKALREHLLYLLGGGGAHVDFDEAFAKLPAKLRGSKPAGAPYTPWQLLEHMRLAQWDILEFSRNPAHVSPAWPEGYWPRAEAPANDAEWNQSVDQFHANLEAMRALAADPGTDLYAGLSRGEGQTVLREALLVADHNSYHLGQFVMLRKMLGAWRAG